MVVIDLSLNKVLDIKIKYWICELLSLDYVLFISIVSLDSG